MYNNISVKYIMNSKNSIAKHFAFVRNTDIHTENYEFWLYNLSINDSIVRIHSLKCPLQLTPHIVP